MVAIALALTAACSWGMSAVFIRMGLQHASTSAGTLVSLVSGLAFTTLLVLVLHPTVLLEISVPALIVFGVVGILNFPLGRFFNYMAMTRLGVTRSTPILASAPVFAVIIAVIFLGERPSLLTVSGIALILCGVYTTLMAQGAAGAATETTDERRRAVAGIAFGLSAALAYGIAQVITRQAVSGLVPPLVGTLIALATGTGGFALITAPALLKQGAQFPRGVWLFAAGGIFSATAVALMFQSLSRGEVVVISPILATNPLFTLLIASLLLRGVERITPKVIGGAVLVVCGVGVLSVG